ncbi:MAG: rhomboid family intramembrane serine protease [Bacteroidales bacterium]|nr:rhomboid family intramembrane serine protease [Bacteroidales bacterium]
MPPVVKNLLIINILACIASYVVRSHMGINVNDYLGLHYYAAQDFGPWQLVTFMFLHGGFDHIFFNMFALFMFGRILEQVWGGKRFLIYYLICGIGSGLTQEVALYFDLNPFIEAIDKFLTNPSNADVQGMMDRFVFAYDSESQLFIQQFINKYNAIVASDPSQALTYARQFFVDYQPMYFNSHITIGASGAVFGILLAFGMLFPNMRLLLLFPPIPIKAKYFVIIYGLIELFLGIASNVGVHYDNVAHWAHLGGMLFGFFLVRKWRNDYNNNMYY